MIFSTLRNEAKDFLGKYKEKDPAMYAAAQEAIGGVLILDGFIGIDNPLGGKKRPGIFGSLAGIIFGAIFLFVPTFFGNVTGINQLTAKTQATVLSVNRQQSTSTDANGNAQTNTTCTAFAKYTVNGKQYTQQSSFGSSDQCSLSAGQTTQISYNPNNPAKWGTGVDTIKKIMKFFPWVGIFIMLSGLVTFLIRLFSIIFGWKLLRSGRALAKTLPNGEGIGDKAKEIEQAFKKSVFGNSVGAGGLAGALKSAVSTAEASGKAPTDPAPPQNTYGPNAQ